MENEIFNLKNELSIMKNRLFSLESRVEVTSLSNSISNKINASYLTQPIKSFADMQKMLKEVQERQKRSKSILVFKCSESNATKEHDVGSVKRFWKNFSISNIRCIGKFNKDAAMLC